MATSDVEEQDAIRKLAYAFADREQRRMIDVGIDFVKLARVLPSEAEVMRLSIAGRYGPNTNRLVHHHRLQNNPLEDALWRLERKNQRR